MSLSCGLIVLQIMDFHVSYIQTSSYVDVIMYM